MPLADSGDQPGFETIRQLLQLRKRLTPHAPCLLASGRTALSYDHLWEQCLYVQTELAAAGLGVESRVAAVLPAGVDAAAALLSFAANCVYVPLNPDDSVASFAKTFTQ